MSNTNSEWVSNTRRQTKQLAYWTLAWVISVAIASFGPKLLWNFNNTASLISIMLCLLLGAGMIRQNMRYINNLDELQRQINLESLSIALGVGIVGGLCYSLLDISNVIASDAEISYLVILMGVTYLVALVAGQMRYK